MKKLLCLSVLLVSGLLAAQSQNINDQEVKGLIDSGEKVLIDNEEIKVVEYTGAPGKDNVCGKGMHYHAPHLTVVLQDAKVQVISEKGEAQDFELPSGAALWFESDTHSVVNTGDSNSKVLLIFPK